MKGALEASMSILRSLNNYSNRLNSVKCVFGIIFKAKSLHDSLCLTFFWFFFLYINFINSIIFIFVLPKNTSDVPPFPKHFKNIKSYIEIS